MKQQMLLCNGLRYMWFHHVLLFSSTCQLLLVFHYKMNYEVHNQTNLELTIKVKIN